MNPNPDSVHASHKVPTQRVSVTSEAPSTLSNARSRLSSSVQCAQPAFIKWANPTRLYTGCRELNPGKAPRQPYSVDHTGGVSVPGPERGAYEDEVYLVTALVPSDTACLASSPGSARRTAVWISREVRVPFLL